VPEALCSPKQDIYFKTYNENALYLGIQRSIMKVPSKIEITDSSTLHIPEGTIIAETLLHFFKYSKLNKVYSEVHDKDPIMLINSLFDQIDLKYEIPESDLNNIPAAGSFIIVSF